MLYLEDYLEMIEHLPQELRDRFTEMRELDLQVQNSMDSIEKRVKIFFSNARKMKPLEKESEYEAIRKNYYKTLEDADEKVQLANHVYELVAKYLRRLDQETHKFKMELEADNMGITEILEKRSHEMDSPSTNSSQKENRFSFSSQRSLSHNEKRRDSSTNVENKRIEKILPELRLPATQLTVSTVAIPQPTPTPPPVSYTLGHIGAGGTAIAAAASQAIAATQQMQQGRRTASLKASYEAIHSGGGGGGSGGGGGVGGPHGHEISISKELAGAAQTAIAAIQDTHKKHKKKSSVLASALAGGGSSTSSLGGVGSGSAMSVNTNPSSSTSLSSSLVIPPSPSTASSVPPSPPPPDTPASSSSSSNTTDRNANDGYDPNEPRYCICNEVAFGTMVACDNKSCPYEWYHYSCVGITDKPKGKWYCPLCTAAMKRRNRKT